jgi:maltose/maltodextrin transport system permease protein
MIVQDKSHRWRVLAAHVAIIGFLCLTLFPFFSIISISLTPGNFGGTGLLPDEITWEHWSLAIGIPYERANGQVIQPPFPVLWWLWNSIKVAAIASGLILILSTTAAYAFARIRFNYKEQILSSLLILQMFPAVLALVAFFTIFDTLGEYIPWLGINTHGGLIFAYVSGIALHIWTIKGYFDTLPKELDEAAIMDGATLFQAFRYVVLPMATPILAVVFVLAFIMSINEYPVASVLLQTEDQLTLAVGSKFYLQSQNFLWGDFAAAALLSGIPITVVFLYAQRWIVGGLSAGGVKG